MNYVVKKHFQKKCDALGTSCGEETQVYKFSIQPNHIFKRKEDSIRECGPIKNNPGAAQCRFECISGWLKAPGF